MFEANTAFLRRVRRIWPLVILSLGLLIIVALITMFGDIVINQTLTEALILIVIVVALFIFIGNSGLLSFGHIGFMLIGAYATAWQTCCPMTREVFMPGLPTYLLTHSHHFLLAIFLAGLLTAAVAAIAGFALMRLSGIASSIGTFAFLMIVNTVYLRWSSWTSGASVVVGIPFLTTPWVGYGFAVITMLGAHVYSSSKFGLALRSTREDEVAAKAAGVNVFRQRLLAFVISAFFAGMAGGLFGHFLGLLTVDHFYLNLTFLTVAMLVIGGMQSLSGAVVGVVVISVLLDVLRRLETGIAVNGDTFQLPPGSSWVGLAMIMILILIFRRNGIIGNAEIYWPFKSETTAEGAIKR